MINIFCKIHFYFFAEEKRIGVPRYNGLLQFMYVFGALLLSNQYESLAQLKTTIRNNIYYSHYNTLGEDRKEKLLPKLRYM